MDYDISDGEIRKALEEAFLAKIAREKIKQTFGLDGNDKPVQPKSDDE